MALLVSASRPHEALSSPIDCKSLDRLWLSLVRSLDRVSVGATVARGGGFMRGLRSLCGVIVLVGLAGAFVPSASAEAAAPSFTGSAPGGVTCALSVKVSFSPPLHLASGGTKPSAVAGTLSGCTTTNPVLAITGGKVSGAFASSPVRCGKLSATGTSLSLSVSWAGSVDGVLGGVTYAGPAHFAASRVRSTSEKIVANASGDEGLAVPGAGSSAAKGSFAGQVTAVAYSPDTGSKLISLCKGAKGLASVTLSGTLTSAGGLPGWPQLHDGAARTGDQLNETRIGPGNVGKLSQARIYPTIDGTSAPLISNGILYVDSVRLYAFSASGGTHCSAAPTTCTPLWTAATAYFDGMVIADGKVFVTDAEGIQAFDAAGSKNCSGTPKVCAPLWATSTHTSTGPSFTPGPGSPAVANGILYVPGYGDGLALGSGGAYVSAFDAAGSKGCSGSPVVCVPIWTTTGLPVSAGNTGSPAIANGVMYIANGTLYAFDAAGSAKCSGKPKVCAPLWTAATSGSPTYSAPAVANGTVYVGSWNAQMYAFAAAGTSNCSTKAAVKTCMPLWTAVTPSSIGGTPAVANGTVYTVSAGGTLSAFSAAGSRNCAGTAKARKCKPLWTSPTGGTGYATSSSPAVANGVVYFSSTNGGTYGYDAAGSLKCSVSRGVRTCRPLWGAVTGFIGGGSPAVVNGVLYINVGVVGRLYAYSLPASSK
jgi:outer membrane protein assembly factor BamB